MAIAHSQFVSGPAYAVYDPDGASPATFYSRDDFTLNPSIETDEVRCDAVGGVVDYTRGDVTIEVSLQPISTWANLDVLIPSFYRTPVLGSRLISTEKKLLIWSSDGELFTLQSAAVTRPPSLNLGPRVDLFGDVGFTGVVPIGKTLGSSDDLYSVLDGQTAPVSASAFDLTNFSRQTWTAAWSGVSGFTEFYAETAFTIELRPTLTKLTQGGLTRNWRLDGMEVSLKCTPIGPNSEQVETAFALHGTGNAQGGRICSSNGAKITLTGANGAKIELQNMTLRTAPSAFGKKLRVSDLEWVSYRALTLGVPQALIVITNPS